MLKRFLKLGTASISFGAGTVFGSVIATLVSAALYNAFGFQVANILLIEECMFEKIGLVEEVTEEVVEEISE